MNAITPEMLLGALVLLAFVLLVFAIVTMVWFRRALRFGRDFKTFSAKREKANIVVEATFGAAPQAAAAKRPTAERLGNWINGRSDKNPGPVRANEP